MATSIRNRQAIPIFILLINLFLASVKVNGQPGQYTWCTKSSVIGMESEAATAASTIGREYTSKLKEVKIYITIKKQPNTDDEFIYLHSNLKPEGFPYPLKAVYPFDTYRDFGNSNLKELVRGLINPGQTGYNELDVNIAYQNHIKFFIENSVFKDKYFASIILGEPKNAKVRYLGDWRQLKQFRSESSIINNYASIKPNLFLKLNNDKVVDLMSKYKNTKFSKEDIRIISLVTNSATEKKIDELIPKSLILNVDFTNLTIDNFRQKLINNKDRTIFLLGHIENGYFVTYDETGRKIFDISISEIAKITQEQNISIFLIGCKSAEFTNGRITSIVNKFNTVQAVEKVSKAINANDYMDFFQKMSSEDLQIVVEENFTNGSQKRRRARLFFYETASTNLAAAILAGSLIVYQATDDDNDNSKTH
ncbi:hypothetical protein LX87_05525 [Larkinella arboricola]|uniref:Uncharacterized protein n=1 Tax=Larkinella arboricola TaxID=643671 RepID=A0A327WNY4_LARAB|nr:hypothetical protein [Larkinella arboricola]RAJ90046.1 hypothetical protein LX87_05525 [Larkinella arboricola]